ncbi:hypothetical protein Ancab_009010 [Ancistrocladus abbreviatus]
MVYEVELLTEQTTESAAISLSLLCLRSEKIGHYPLVLSIDACIKLCYNIVNFVDIRPPSPAAPRYDASFKYTRTSQKRGYFVAYWGYKQWNRNGITNGSFIHEILVN